MKFSLPLRLVNSTNKREHWAVRSKRTKEQRGLVRFAVKAREGAYFNCPATVTITRIGKRAMDSDGLQASAKAVRDGIADALGINDGDETKAVWKYAQKIGADYAVEIEII